MLIEVPVLTVFLGNAEDKDTNARDALQIKPIFLPSLSLLSPPQLPALASAQHELVHTGAIADLPKTQSSAPYLNSFTSFSWAWKRKRSSGKGVLRRTKKPPLQQTLTWL